MSNINKIILIGRLGRDPEVRYLENGASVAKIAVATTESYKDKSGEWQEQTEWHDVVMWRFLAERAEKTLKKGALVYIEGKLKHRKYQKEGEETARRISEVVADTFRLLSKREGFGESSNFPTAADEMAKPSTVVSNQDTTSSSPEAQNTPAPAKKEVVEDPSDDLPF